MSIDLLVGSALSGFFAAFSPCNLPIYPVMLNILAADGKGRRRNALAFTAGLMLAFTAFYVAVGFMLKLLSDAANAYLEHFFALAYALAAVICMLFALQSAGILTFWTRTYMLKHNPRGGVLGATLTGAFFATIASPCNIAFIITGILPVLLSSATVFEGLAYMATFSLSMSIPVLAIGLLTGHALDKWLISRGRQIFPPPRMDAPGDLKWPSGDSTTYTAARPRRS
jgi:cytochrome c biogenesis protein CcdA